MKDVIELIEQDHREMERMFRRLRSGDGDRELVYQSLAALLTAHARAEEAEVYPAVRDAGEVKHSRQEHAQADDLLAKLKELDAGTAEFGDTLDKLAESVLHHIKDEESGTLPALRENSTARERAALADRFLRRRGEELRAGPSPRQVGGSELTKEKLYSKAREHDIAGRASMTKEELAEAVKAAAKSE